MMSRIFSRVGGRDKVYETSYWVVSVGERETSREFLSGALLLMRDPALATKYRHEFEAIGARKAWLAMPVATGIAPDDVRIHRVRSRSILDPD